MQDEIQQARTFPSLRREPPILGLPARAAAIAAGIIFLVIAARGIDLISLTIAAFLWLLVVAVLRPQFQSEPDLLDILPALTRYQERYARHGRMGSTPHREPYIKSRPQW